MLKSLTGVFRQSFIVKSHLRGGKDNKCLSESRIESLKKGKAMITNPTLAMCIIVSSP